MGTDETTSDTESAGVEEVTSILEAYFDGLRANDVGDVPFAQDVVWENPVTRREEDPIQGRENVVEALEEAAANMPRIDIEQHVIDGQKACTVFEWENREGIACATVDYFEIEDGAITLDRTYLDLSVLQDE